MMNKIKLGQNTLESNVILAPMAGVTDLPFRKIVREFGNFLMFSEMIASQAVIRHVKKTFKMIEGADTDSNTSVQIVGADPYVMAEAAKLSQDLGAKFIDINMGCPVKKIVKSESGSALMKDENLALSIIESVVKAVLVPVTLKMRLGWDQNNKNAPKIAKLAENSGISMITVHARTRSQMYSGNADWKEVFAVKKEVKNIPVIINGDITSIESAKKALDESFADGVMIGRGALGQPWILSDIHEYFETGKNNNSVISEKKKFEIAKKHVEYMSDFYDHETAYKLCRKVLVYYCRGIHNASKFRNRINNISSKNEVFELLHEFFEQ